MELTGTVKVIFDEKVIKSSFRKREMVLTTQDRYPQPILVEFTQDKIALLDRVQPGDEVKVSINIRGREWTSPRGETKYFVSIQGWRIEKLAHETAHDGGSIPDAPPDDAPFPDSPNGGDSFVDDDIPF